MNNNSLTETGNSEKGLVLPCFILQIFVQLFILCLFLPKRYSLKIVVPRFKNKKRQFIILAESLKNTLEGVLFSKFADLLAAT